MPCGRKKPHNDPQRDHCVAKNSTMAVKIHTIFSVYRIPHPQRDVKAKQRKSVTFADS